jgi:transcriptional regulator with XRE-family HTH domain
MTKVHYGRLLANARVEKGLTQAEMGDRLGVSQVSISQFEARENVEVETMERYALALGVTFQVGG